MTRILLLVMLSLLAAGPSSGSAQDIDRTAVDHFNPNDRFFVVISGTWWMGTGETFDPNATVPARAGSYVIHYANTVHYDGAKDDETIIEVWGIGPATSTPAGRR